MWQRVRTFLFPPPANYIDPNIERHVLLTQGRDRILIILLRLTSLAGILTILSIMDDLLQRQRWDLVLVYLAGMVAIGVVSYLRQIRYTFRALTFLGILYVLGVIDLSFFGIAEDWRLYFSAFSILSALFLGWRVGLVALLLSLATFVLLSWQIHIGAIVITASSMESPIPTVDNIIAFSLAFVLTNAIVISAIISLLKEFENATENERQVALALKHRTAELERSLKREQKLALAVANALEREEELNKLRSKIITTISHEFRTPLTVINNSATLLKKYYDRLSPAKREEQYTRIHQSLSYLTRLLQGVSIVENTQSKTIHLQRELFKFGALCQRLTTKLRQETADPPNLEIVVIGDKTTPIVLDFNLLKQALLNLLSNALKYSPSHLPVRLDIELNGDLKLTVTDQGIGIPDAEKDKVWQLFYRGSNVEAPTGLGLGLYVVKQLVDTMGGTVTLADNPAGGTVFTVKLPMNTPLAALPLQIEDSQK